MRHSVDRLILFLKSLVSKFFPPDRIIVALPVLPESGQMPVAIQWPDGRTVTKRDKTEVAVHFNQLLRQSAAAEGFAVMDITPLTMSTKTGLLNVSFVEFNAAGQGNPHLKKEAASPLWLEELQRLLASQLEIQVSVSA
jgi:hypothetical protein